MQSDAQALAAIACILVAQVHAYSKARITDASSARAIKEVWNARERLLTEFESKLHELDVRDEINENLLRAAHETFPEARATIGQDTTVAIEDIERGENYLRNEIDMRTRDDGLTTATRLYLMDVLLRIRAGQNQIESIKLRLNA